MSETTAERPYHHGNLRSAILAAAESRLRTAGAEQISLRELAREVGVSHAAPRRHFADRQALLDALAETGFERLGDVLREALTGASDTFPAQVLAVMTAYTRFATENGALLELMYAAKHRPGATRIAAAAEGPFGLMNDLVARGQTEGAIRAGDPLRVGMVVFATVQGIASLINGGFVERAALDGLVADATDQFLRGAAPLP
ncbi:TetR/AcrR family transcriptional regulator [Streptomyces bohaiensis]|uniref:TetR/AcrR family transcriptional regulator n=1 Tax=Streptomyces bohaiensis TaxID=1431344 RepID=A0ABX1CCS0_9ACTN|nr:TetR/AcrR family transcriptional regulator [Streptomyces bohaiensis]NJQ15703.1 TetR/AcrR family transcriptional regulator [Streptomyces bohaiensis]